MCVCKERTYTNFKNTIKFTNTLSISVLGVGVSVVNKRSMAPGALSKKKMP